MTTTATTTATTAKNKAAGFRRRFWAGGAATRAVETLEDGTVIIRGASVSSDQPIPFGRHIEVLEHTAAAVNLSRVDADGVPLLFNHDPDRLIGRVLPNSGRFEDGRLLLDLTISRAEDVADIRAKVADGTLQNISIGYHVEKEEVLNDDADGYAVYRATAWRLLEVSLVSVPADASVGIHRDWGTSGYNQPPRGIDKEGEGIEMADAKTENNNDAQRVKNVAAQLRSDGAADLAFAVLSGEKSPDSALLEYRAEAIAGRDAAEAQAKEAREKMESQREQLAKAESDLAELRKAAEKSPRIFNIHDQQAEHNTYSLTRAMGQFANEKQRDGLEGEVEREARSERAQLRLDTSPSGILVPQSVLCDIFNARLGLVSKRRDLDGTAGVGLLGEDRRPSSLIELLRTLLPEAAYFQMIQAMENEVVIPRQTGSASAHWVSTDSRDNPTESNLTISDLTLDPRTVGTNTAITRKVLLSGNPSAISLVMADAVEVILRAIAKAAIEGDGTGNTPTGITNTTGVGSFVFGDPGDTDYFLTPEEVGKMLATINEANVVLPPETSGILCRAAMKYNTETREFADGVTIPAAVNGRILDTRFIVSTNALPSDNTEVVVGDFSQVLIAYWGSSVEFREDMISSTAGGGSIIRAFHDANVGIRHPAAFVHGEHATI